MSAIEILETEIAPTLIGVLASAVLVISAAVAGVFAFFVLWIAVAYARRAFFLRAARAPAGAGALALLMLREAWAQLRIVGWTLLRRGRSLAQPREGVPVVLIHGMAADGTSMWGLRKSLDVAGRPTRAPHLGGMFRPIEKYALLLVPELAGHGPFDVVCHSMGGVILRACLAARPELADKIRHVVTIASPHDGTAGAAGLPFVEARQLHRSPMGAAPWLRALPTLRALLPRARITTIASAHDAVVYPPETSRVEGGVHHELLMVGHAELLVHKGVAEIVVASVS